ncbi:MAG: hypothetical protein GQ583_06385 [Methyloprofundus sp.]|nr:hypothetical protein [Methyloprofundus sp.]
MKNITFNHRQVWRLALPMIIANISTPLLGLVDTSLTSYRAKVRPCMIL